MTGGTQSQTYLNEAAYLSQINDEMRGVHKEKQQSLIKPSCKHEENIYYFILFGAHIGKTKHVGCPCICV